MQIPGVCNGNSQTVVFAHRPGGGMGRKQPDLFGADCCHTCHMEIDGQTRHIKDRELVDYYHLKGMERTQHRLLHEGLIKI